jgi:hypothetical protein
VLKYGAILHVSLTKDGDFTGGKVVSTYMNDRGVPTRDDDERAWKLIRDLSDKDFGGEAAKIGEDGSITPPG